MADNYFRQISTIVPSLLKVRNFKSLQDNQLKLEAITVLLGSNSSGKSSIIQSILLLAFNSSQEKPEDFNFNGPLVSLGSPASLLTKTRDKKQARTMNMSLDFEIYPNPDNQTKTAGIDIELIRERKRLGSGSMKLYSFQLRQSVGNLNSKLRLKITKEFNNSIAEINFAKITGDYIVEQNAKSTEGFGLDLENLAYLNQIEAHNLLFNQEKGSKYFKNKINGLAKLKSGDRYLPSVQADRPVYTFGDVTNCCLEYCAERLIEDILRKSRSEENGTPASTVEQITRVRTAMRRARLMASQATIPDSIAEKFVDSLELIVDKGDPVEIHDYISSHFRDKANNFSIQSINTYSRYLAMKVQNGSKLKKKQFLIFPLSGRSEKRKYDSAIKINGEIMSYLRNQIHYLGPLRAFSQSEQKFFPPISNLCPIGVRGESLSWVLSSEQMNLEDDFPYPPINFDDHTRIRHSKFGEALDAWIRWFGLGSKFTLAEDGSWGKFIEIDSEKLSQKGTGISQVLPVVALCLMAKPGSLCLLEQPELHLHPSLQQTLGTFFAHMVGSGRRLLLETHSEYLVTRLRREIAVGKLENRHLSLCFVSKEVDSENPKFMSTSITQVPVSEFGLVENWPEAYFDFTADDNLDIFEAASRD